MSLPISPLTAASITGPEPLAGASNSNASSFQKMFESAVQNVENSSAQAETAVSNYLSGGTNQELHSTILATQNADLNFQMFMQVRNKVVSAYEEIMKMQV
jgi:flagellar hook-basal body complex protein FliE